MELARKPSVSFVIPAWNEERHLAMCLRAIDALTFPAGLDAIETIVVDNQSTDQTATVAAEHGARVVSVAPGRVSRARNAGARASQGEWLAFVDADCELSPDWLVECSRHFRDDRIVAIGAAMRSPAKDASWVERTWYAIAAARQPQQAAEVRWLPSFNLLVQKQAFDEIGGFNEDLETCEDCDLGYRLAERGRLVFEPSTTAAHHGESRTLLQLFRREAWRSHGNLRLARQRKSDLRNWLSLLLPPASVAGFVGAIAFAFAAARFGGAYWLGSLASLAIFAIPYGMALSRVMPRAPTGMLPSILLVLGTYLTARTAGLFFSMPRVTRDAS